MNCSNKVALVTGAAGNGLGRSIALTLAREGARVVVNYRTGAERAAEIVAHIQASGGEALAVAADVFTPEGCERLFAAAVERFGQVDICVIGPGGDFDPLEIDKLDPAAALENLERETGPLLRLMRLVLPGMYARRWGRVITIASHPHKVSPAYAYNLGKAARLQALLLAQDQA